MPELEQRARERKRMHPDAKEIIAQLETLGVNLADSDWAQAREFVDAAVCHAARPAEIPENLATDEALRQLRAWNQLAMNQLAKADKLKELLPAKYLGWDVYEAIVDHVNSLSARSIVSEIAQKLRAESEQFEAQMLGPSSEDDHPALRLRHLADELESEYGVRKP